MPEENQPSKINIEIEMQRVNCDENALYLLANNPLGPSS